MRSLPHTVSFHPAGGRVLRDAAVALLTEQIERVQDRLNPRLQLDGVLLTMVDMRTLHSREVMSSVRQGFGDKVYDTYISRTVKFPDALTISAAVADHRVRAIARGRRSVSPPGT